MNRVIRTIGMYADEVERKIEIKDIKIRELEETIRTQGRIIEILKLKNGDL